MKITGSQAHVFFDSFDESKMISYSGTPQLTAANKWYLVFDKGAASNLPVEKGFPFRAPQGTDQIALVAGDRIFPINEKRFCKTTASFSAEQGTVDVSDDCDPGATILDGIIKITGSLAGLFRYDDQSGEFDDVTDEMINRFFEIIEDDGNGIYSLKERNDTPIYILTCLNSNAKAGQTENWLFVPINISSMSMNLGNTDAQNKDLSWSKGEGKPVIYKRPKPV
ncbi:MAG: hypothetical protein FWD40_10025 [Treponema sp.]|nr:hypothetical protein [Treponema sp.]